MKYLLMVLAIAASAITAPAYAGGSGGYDTFENVARGSHKVTTSSGQTFNLRNIGGNTQACEPPRKLVRTEQCRSIPNGGIRCKFDCQLVSE